MGFFDATRQALAEGKTVFYSELYDIGFRSGTGYYWDGFGDLLVDGNTYSGAANVVSRSEIPFGIDDEAGQLTITMSGVNAAILAMVRAEEVEIAGQPLKVWGLFFDEALQPSGGKWLLFSGIMDTPSYSAGTERTVIIPCEGEFTDRNLARFSLFSDVDQKGRFPGDRGLEYVYRYTLGVKRRWPQF